MDSWEKVYLGIDGGGTRTRAVLVGPDLQILGESEGGPSSLYYTDPDTLACSIRDAFSGALQDAASKKFSVKRSDIVRACVAMAGAGRQDDRNRAVGILKPVFEAPNVSIPFSVVEDSRAALAACHEGQDGLIVIAGTGSNCLGVREGMYAQSGGWGSLLADEGSAYSIARRSLIAVVRAHDGRGQETSLTGYILKELGLSSPPDLVLATHRMDRTAIASLAKLTFEAAESGDSVAIEILRSEAQLLVELVKAVCTRLKMTHPRVGAIGGCFRSHLYWRMFEESVTHLYPNARVVPEKHTPAVGAALLAMKESASLEGGTRYGR